jgi:hypothetical protein
MADCALRFAISNVNALHRKAPSTSGRSSTRREDYPSVSPTGTRTFDPPAAREAAPPACRRHTRSDLIAKVSPAPRARTRWIRTGRFLAGGLCVADERTPAPSVTANGRTACALPADLYFSGALHTLRRPARPLTGSPARRAISTWPCRQCRLGLGYRPALGGRVLLRIEDHDRSAAGRLQNRRLDDLDWRGWSDLAPTAATCWPPEFRQSGASALPARSTHSARPASYACDCSRKTLAKQAGDLRRGTPQRQMSRARPSGGAWSRPRHDSRRARNV